ncbi:hypothetical protein ABZ912_36005 [Nonomuraea angiospora]|uniref:hypothetical protein n=1 Tax=Nonomuraea angiospora TaxID=46172 RepID=UPI0033FF2444
MAARDFLHDSGHLLTQHLISQAAHPVAATPADHGHDRPDSFIPPASTAAGP